MKVTVKMQAEGNPPVEYVHTGRADVADEVDVMLAITQIFSQRKDESPWKPEILSITIDVRDERRIF